MTTLVDKLSAVACTSLPHLTPNFAGVPLQEAHKPSLRVDSARLLALSAPGLLSGSTRAPLLPVLYLWGAGYTWIHCRYHRNPLTQ